MAEAILVADDEAGIRESLAEILRDAGYAVETAADGAAALEAIDGHDFTVVIGPAHAWRGRPHGAAKAARGGAPDGPAGDDGTREHRERHRSPAGRRRRLPAEADRVRRRPRQGRPRARPPPARLAGPDAPSRGRAPLRLRPPRRQEPAYPGGLSPRPEGRTHADDGARHRRERLRQGGGGAR